MHDWLLTKLFNSGIYFLDTPLLKSYLEAQTDICIVLSVNILTTNSSLQQTTNVHCQILCLLRAAVIDLLCALSIDILIIFSVM